jgi:uncharacterized membrane protein YdjX (TVP38/TMEM64 family)
MTLRTVLPRLVLGLAIVGTAIWLALNRGRLDPSLIQGWAGDLGAWAPLGHVILFALGTILFAPGALFGLAGGVLFGPVWGTVLNLTGATLGATAAFLVARYITADWVRAKAGSRLERLIAGVEAEGWRFIAFVRLVPLFPFNLLNYALGLTRIPLISYILASLVCMAPGTVAYTWLGYAGREAIAGSDAATRCQDPRPRCRRYSFAATMRSRRAHSLRSYIARVRSRFGLPDLSKVHQFPNISMSLNGMARPRSVVYTTVIGLGGIKAQGACDAHPSEFVESGHHDRDRHR